MKIDKTKKTKRICIYAFYDKDGIVDDWVIYLLKDLLLNIEKLVVVSNGKLNNQSRKKLTDLNIEIIERENKWFDIWGYKTGLERYGFDELEKYDEVVLLNNSIMGPIYPFKEAFDEMSNKDVDFWGMTKHHKIPFDIFEGRMPDGIPEHIQSSFMVFRKSLVQTKEFRDYWDNLPIMEHYYDAICLHEAIFTKKFEKLGFKWDVYVNTDDLETTAYYPLQMMPRELLENRRCPIFKRRNFFHDYQAYINYTAGETTYEMLEYIDKQTDYDTDLIWQNVLRTMNQADFKKPMQLNYILSTQNAPQKLKQKKVALLMHLYFMDLLDESLKYAESMPEYASVYITTNTEEKKKQIKQKFKTLKCKSLEVIVIENRGRDVSSVIVAGREFLPSYDYVCFVHDKKVNQLMPKTIGKSFAYQCFECLLKNKMFVNNVIDTFEKNPRLGMLMPPLPFHADYFPTLGKEFRGNYEDLENLLKDISIELPIDKEKEPITPLGTMFWFRPKSFKCLFDSGFKFEDFPKEPNKIDRTILHVLERAYGYAVQYEGYYPAWVLSDTYAKVYITNLTFTVREFNKIMFDSGIEGTQYNMCGELDRRLKKLRELEEENKELNRRIQTGEVSLKTVLKRFIKKFK